jgi:acetate---CoA ligase (ADP-forming)
MTLQALLAPRSIAIIGASAVPTRIGGIPLKLLTDAGFDKIYPINPKYPQIGDRPCYPDIESVPEPVDLVLLAIAAEEVLPTLERCHAAGARAAIVFAAGYAETNKPDGIARQERLAAFARRTGMRIAGPNCMGNANLASRVFTTFGTSVLPGEPAGDTALVTQSGNMSATVYRTARRAGVAFSHVINTGNEADVGFADYLDFLADDDATRAVLCYIEELRDGRAFLQAAAKFRARDKLLAVYKVGSTEKGAEAARSHTAALAGNAAAYDAAFAAAGVARAADLAGLSDLAYLHAFGSKIAGNACAILTISGAAGAILSDALILNGGQVPTLPEDVQAKLRARIPDFGMVTNPVDLTGNLVNANDFLFDAIKLALQPDSIQVLIVYLPGYFLDRALDQLERAAAEAHKAVVVIDTFALGDRDTLRKVGIALFDDFDRAARAIATYGNWKASGVAHTVPADAAVSWPSLPTDRSSLSETEGKQALARFGLPVVSDTLVQSRAEARRAAEHIGFPLVLKLVSADVAHKTEHGLVRLGLQSADAVAEAFDAVMHKASSMALRVDGVTLEPMLSGGIEILVGVTRDPVFDWMLTVGLGGIWTELMRDVRHRLLPVDAAGAETMLRELKGFALLNGYRGAPKADVKAAAQAIAALCRAVIAGGDRLREVEINPLLVMSEGTGAVAIDALVLLNSPPGDEVRVA